MTSIGTGYVDVRGDLSSLNKQLAAAFSGGRIGGLGKKAGLAIGVGLGAGLAAAGAGKALFDLGEKFDTEFDKIRVGTGATGKSLQGLQGDFKNVLKSVPTDFGSAGDAVAGLAQRLDITGKPLQRLSKQILQLSKITETDVGENVASVTRLFGDWGVSTAKQSGTLDRLFRVTQKTGINLGDLSRFMVAFGSPLRQLGFGFDEAAVMFGKFEKEGVNLQTIMPGFRFALKNLSAPTGEAADALKKLGISAKDPKVALQEVFDAIKKAPTDLKANAIAFAIFGRRAGPDMAAAIREGRFEYGNLIRQMRDGKDTINKAERDTRDFSEEWQLFKNRLAVRLEPVATSVFQSVGKIMKIVGDPNLSGAEKWDRISDIIVPAFEKALEGAATAAERYGPKIAGALFRGFLNAPPLVQLIGGAWLLKKAGPMLAAAGLLGRQSGAAFSTGMATTVATGGAGGAAGGAAAGGLAGFGAKLAKFAKVGVGVATGAAILEGIRGRLESPDAGLQKRLKQLQAPGVLGTRSIVATGQRLVAKLPGIGIAKGDFAAQIDGGKELQKVLGQINTASGSRLGLLQRQAAELAKQLDLNREQKAEISSLFRLKATTDVSKALGGITEASRGAQDALPAVVAAQKRVNELRRQGKTDTHAYAEAIRALDAAEAVRKTALDARAAQQRRALDATKADLSAAKQTLSLDRRLGASKEQLREDLSQVAQAASRQQAALANVSRAMAGLTPITGAAGTKMGALLKQLQGVEGAGKFKKFLITADLSSVEKGIKLVDKLKDLGRGRTAMKIFADSKTPEEALKRLQRLANDLDRRERRVRMRFEDKVTLGVERLKRLLDHLPTAKKITLILQEQRQKGAPSGPSGPGGLDYFLPPVKRRAKGGKAHGWNVVGEEGPELAHFSQPTDIVSHPLSKKLVKGMGVPGFAKGTVTPGQVSAIAKKKRRPEEDPPPEERRGKRGQRLQEEGAAEARSSRKDDEERQGTGKGRAILDRANKLDRLHLPYVWGGGHGSYAEALRAGFDCSGAVSYVLGISPRVSGDLAGYGVPGKGPVSIFANAKHTFMSIFGRGFGTGKENPDGGPGWLSYASRSGFTVSHLAGVTQAAKGKAGKPRAFRNLSLGQYITVAKEVDFPDPALAASIFYAESRGKVNAVGDSGESLGAAQIHTPSHPKYDHEKLRDDIFYNFRAAKAISKGGRDFSPWTQYRNAAYKQFLGGKARPLPKGESAGAGGTTKADLIELAKIKALDTLSPKDDLRAITRGLRYWRGVYRRNKRAGNTKRQIEALQNVQTLKAERKELKTKEEDPNLFKLDDLATIGKGPNAFNIGGLQRVIDQIDLEKAHASLTVPRDDDDTQAGIAASLADDIAAASKLEKVWEGLNTLVSGFFVPSPLKGTLFTPTREQSRQLNATKNQTERIGLLNQFIAERDRGTFISGTIKQKIEAATGLASARVELKSLTDEAGRTDETTTPGTEQDSRIADLLRQQLEESQKELAISRAQTPVFERFKNAPRFHEGGIVKGQSGSEVPAYVTPREGIFTPEQMEALGGAQTITVVVEDGAVDPNKIRVEAGNAVGEMVRKARSGGPAVGQKMAFPR